MVKFARGTLTKTLLERHNGSGSRLYSVKIDSVNEITNIDKNQ